MNLTKIKNGILETFEIMGYSRAANELLKLSDAHLDDLGISRTLLEQGYKAYPWREDGKGQAIPNNVTSIQSTQIDVDTLVKPRRPRAA